MAEKCPFHAGPRTLCGDAARLRQRALNLVEPCRRAREAMHGRHALKKSRAKAKEVLASLEIAFMYRTRDAIRTCLWPIVVMQRRNASFLAVPVVVDRVPRGRSIWLLSDAGPQRPGPKPRTG